MTNENGKLNGATPSDGRTGLKKLKEAQRRQNERGEADGPAEE
ncbi:hypothetical protein [Rhodovibrio sodomensis]|nr:hypothetical protein [Rhodovibrio sodomensis]